MFIPSRQNKCRFGSDCTYAECRFFHETKSEHLTKCRYGASCTRPDCRFLHDGPSTKPPRLSKCRYGASCTRQDCHFLHDVPVASETDVALGQILTWISSLPQECQDEIDRELISLESDNHEQEMFDDEAAGVYDQYEEEATLEMLEAAAELLYEEE